MINDIWDHWDGDVLYTDRTITGMDVVLPLSEVQKRFMGPTGTCAKITDVAVYDIYRYTVPRCMKDVVLLKTTSNCFWTMYFDVGLCKIISSDKLLLRIIRHYEDTPAVTIISRRPLVVKRKEESRITVNQFFKFLYLEYIPEIQYDRMPGDNRLFAEEIFNKLVKSNTMTVFGSIALSQSRGIGKSYETNSGWKGIIKYVDKTGYNDFYEQNMYDLSLRIDPTETKRIERICLYKTPLNEHIQFSNLYFFHSYLVFKSNDGVLTEWWSLEKNGTFLVLQKFDTESEVRDKLLGEKRCESKFYWKPQQIIEDTSDMTLAELIIFLYTNEELQTKYNAATENCQTFSKVVFDVCAKTKIWDYGWVLGTLKNWYETACGLGLSYSNNQNW